jgi:hypothetical protein
MFVILPNGGEGGALIAPAGTRIPFNQAAAPNGWTQDTGAGLNDCSMRVVTGAGGTQGGSTLWSSWNFGGTFGVNGFTISVAQMPGHNHGISDPTHSHGTANHNHTINGGTASFLVNGGSGAAATGGAFSATSATDAASVSVNAASTGISTQNNGSGAGIFPTYTTPQVKYTDFIMGVKS